MHAQPTQGDQTTMAATDMRHDEDYIRGMTAIVQGGIPSPPILMERWSRIDSAKLRRGKQGLRKRGTP
eukprot:scaffold9379_cov86-Amphora_coffeaeformis.AAC.1